MTRQKAIDAMCKQCIYDPKSGLGTWRQQTQGCTSTLCPLWPYRPRMHVKPLQPGPMPAGLKRWREQNK